MDIFRKIEIDAHTFKEKLYVDDLLPDPAEFESEIESSDREYKLTREDLDGLNLGGSETSLEDLFEDD